MYNPDPEHLIDGGTTLIVMGDNESVTKLRKILDDSALDKESTSRLPSVDPADPAA